MAACDLRVGRVHLNVLFHQATVVNANAMKTFLNAFLVTNATDLQWNAVTYRVNKLDRSRPAKRGEAKNAVWRAKGSLRSLMPGLGFVVETSCSTVVVPSAWNLPSGRILEGFEYIREDEFVVTPGSSRFESVFREIINEGVRRHFKKNRDERLGPVWQDFNNFCEIPRDRTQAGFAFCRRFDCDAKPMGFSWALRFALSTASVDGRSISEYYEQGRVGKLAEMVESKLSVETRTDEPPAVRVLNRSKVNGELSVKAYDIVDPRLILENSKLGADEQRLQAGFKVGKLGRTRLNSLVIA